MAIFDMYMYLDITAYYLYNLFVVISPPEKGGGQLLATKVVPQSRKSTKGH